LGGSLKAEGFGDGEYRRSHPQAALEAATLPSYQINFDRLIGFFEFFLNLCCISISYQGKWQNIF
jgi:hypothetical protein